MPLRSRRRTAPPDQVTASDWAAQLRAAGYTSETLKRLLHVSVPDDVGWLNHAPALERLRGDRSAAATLVRLLFLETGEAAGAVTTALSRRACEAWITAAALRRQGATICARVRVEAVGDLYFMADRRFLGPDPGALRLGGGDPVYPPSSDSLLLRDALALPPGGRVLDLCTGSGIQALRGAATAQQVVAVDINPRAAAMARLNAQLNGVGNVEVRVGNLYAPVAGESFDAIVANPPFVSSPYATGPSYHSGGPTGDRVLRRILAGLRHHLRPGGRAFAVSHVALRRGEQLEAVAAAWFRDFPGRALVLVCESGSAVDLAAAQALFALRRGFAAYAAEVARWMLYLRRQRIETVSLVLIAAQHAGPVGVEVVDAQVRVLPIPLSAAPADRLRAWLA